MLQKDGFFRKREEKREDSLFRPSQAVATAPVPAANADVDVDLSVPGFKYAISGDAKAIPLAPIVNTFQPERKGQVQGTLTAQGKLAGTGTSGASLKKTLAGQFDMSSTNLNLAVQNIKNPMLKALVEVIVIIPDLAQNPGGALGSLGKGVLGSSSGSGGASDDLKKSPINAIILRGKAGGRHQNSRSEQDRSEPVDHYFPWTFHVLPARLLSVRM